MRRTVGLLAFASLCAHAAGEAPGMAMANTEAPRWGTLSRIVKPEYPTAAKQAHISGYVDVSGTVNRMGYLLAPKLVASSPEAEPFVSDLNEVIEHWRFVPMVDASCTPIDHRVRARVTYDWDAQEPRIAVTQGEPTKLSPLDNRTDMIPLDKMHPKYPRSMLGKAVEGEVFAIVSVDPEGRVSDVTSQVISSHREAREFQRTTHEALRWWKFPAAPNGSTLTRTGCIHVSYRMTGY